MIWRVVVFWKDDHTKAKKKGQENWREADHIAVYSNYARHLISNPDYDDKNLYKYSIKELGIDSVCPAQRYKTISKHSLELVCFNQSALW